MRPPFLFLVAIVISCGGAAIVDEPIPPSDGEPAGNGAGGSAGCDGGPIALSPQKDGGATTPPCEEIP
jgi:hypothetical protein